VVLDGIQLLRGAFIRMEEYSLDAVAEKVLGQRKLLHGPDRAREILTLYERDPARFCEYNLTDARLALDVLRRLRVIDLAVERSLLTGMPLDRVSGSIASFDFLYLSELGRRGVVAPTVTWDDEPEEPTMGGTVLEPEPGLHRNVLVFDFKSLYPSIIRTFQIDPLGYLPSPQPGDDPIVAPSGAAFRRRPGILTQLLDRLAPQREAAQRAGDTTKSYAIKILMNSFYGVLGTPACRFHNPELANAITSFGHMVLLHAKARIEARGHKVLYGDTDSLFVLSGAADPEAARALGGELAEAINEDLRAHLRSAYRVESRLHLSFQALYLRLLLLRTRGGAQGARKRYAGLLAPASDGEAPRVVFTGMEVVRSDWTELAKEVQRRLYERLFADQPVETYLREVVAAVRAGKMDELLVYRKSLRKDLQRYTATTPPHVAAARKMAGAPGRTMAYVMTRNGPEPAAERRSPVDHEHYVQKQVRPVAEPVLSQLGLDFDRVVGDNTQLELGL
jgi:DNA polymerase-2